MKLPGAFWRSKMPDLRMIESKSRRGRLIGREVLVVSHASPAVRGRVGVILDVRGYHARVSVPLSDRYRQVESVNLLGLRRP